MQYTWTDVLTASIAHGFSSYSTFLIKSHPDVFCKKGEHFEKFPGKNHVRIFNTLPAAALDLLRLAGGGEK